MIIIRLLYTDTDSFISKMKTDHVYQDLKNNLDSYDTSNYPENNIYETPQFNKKVSSNFKDELN